MTETEARWTREVAPYPDLVAKARAGRSALQLAAAEARDRDREERNARLERAQDAAWRHVLEHGSVMTCPSGHAIACRGCVDRMAAELLAAGEPGP